MDAEINDRSRVLPSVPNARMRSVEWRKGKERKDLHEEQFVGKDLSSETRSDPLLHSHCRDATDRSVDARRMDMTIGLSLGALPTLLLLLRQGVAGEWRMPTELCSKRVGPSAARWSLWSRGSSSPFSSFNGVRSSSQLMKIFPCPPPMFLLSQPIAMTLGVFFFFFFSFPFSMAWSTSSSSSKCFTDWLKFLFQSEWMLVVTSCWNSSSRSLDWRKCSSLEFIDDGRMIRRSSSALTKREVSSSHCSSDSRRRRFVSDPRRRESTRWTTGFGSLRRSPMMTFPNEPLIPNEEKVLRLKRIEQFAGHRINRRIFVDEVLRFFSDLLAKLISQFQSLERIASSNIEKFSAVDSESWTRAFDFSARYFWTSSRVQFDQCEELLIDLSSHSISFACPRECQSEVERERNAKGLVHSLSRSAVRSQSAKFSSVEISRSRFPLDDRSLSLFVVLSKCNVKNSLSFTLVFLLLLRRSKFCSLRLFIEWVSEWVGESILRDQVRIAPIERRFSDEDVRVKKCWSSRTTSPCLFCVDGRMSSLVVSLVVVVSNVRLFSHIEILFTARSHLSFACQSLSNVFHSLSPRNDRFGTTGSTNWTERRARRWTTNDSWKIFFFYCFGWLLKIPFLFCVSPALFPLQRTMKRRAEHQEQWDCSMSIRAANSPGKRCRKTTLTFAKRIDLRSSFSSINKKKKMSCFNVSSKESTDQRRFKWLLKKWTSSSSSSS